MAYQVLARKWRPQRFDDVIGQQAVTRTLKNALSSRRLAQAFVFAGPRGVGKTTTARILARALNCVKGPTPDPCGECDACVEIAEGRDIDVLEIDAATHTGIDNVRDVIISGLAIVPVRNRFKIFIIDEVHQLSVPSFNALLKSIEEPPPHVVFMMATTELEKIPDTVLSRSQVYELRTIGTRAIAEQLRRIVDAEEIVIPDAALQLLARDAEGSMRDAQSKLDQVIAFTGKTVTTEDISTVLGLVGRDLLLDTVQAVADEDAAAAFVLAGRAVEMGYDLRLVCRELSRLVRDLLVLSVDPSRLSDPEIAGEGERDRLTSLAARFSREDLLRSFDVLTRAEFDIRGAAQPRYHLEMALLRWIHLRKLMPIEDLIAGAASATAPPSRLAPAPASRAAPALAPASASRPALAPPSTQAPASTPKGASAPGMPPARPTSSAVFSPGATRPQSPPVGPRAVANAPADPDASGIRQAAETAPDGTMGVPIAQAGTSTASADDTTFKDAFLAEVRKTKVVFYNMVVAQAQRIEVSAERVAFTFSATQRTLCETFEQQRGWLESIATRLAGRKVAVIGVQSADAATPLPGQAVEAAGTKKSALREQALADAGVQALLEVFPAEIRDVEEM
jgi:DNA polymerase-3 subunit gamma/tau